MSTDYRNTVFAIVKPPARIISTHLVKNDAERLKLVKKAQEKEYCLYQAATFKKGDKIAIKMPWILDENTIPREQTEVAAPTEVARPAIFACQCGKKCTSKSGLTLHMKTCSG